MIIALSWRLARGARVRLVLLAACVAIGVAARAFVGTLTAQAQVAVAREARPLLGGDLEISAHAPISDAHRKRLEELLPPGWQATETIGFTSMAASATATRIVEVRAVGAGYPLLDPVPLAAQLPTVATLADAIAVHGDEAGIAVEASALSAFSIALGDAIDLGRRRYVVRAVLGDDPGLTGSPFTLGPRLVIHRDTVASTGLGGFGSRSTHALLIRLSEPLLAEATAENLAETWKLEATELGFGARGSGDTGLQVRTAQQAQFGLRRVFDRLGDFLRLAALGSLLIAAVGVAALVSHTIRARADELAILATLGCPPRRSARILFIQTLVTTMVGAACGALAGAGIAWLVLRLFRDAFPMPIEAGLDWPSLLSGWGIGVVIAIIAALIPLSGLRRAQPLAILRGESGTQRRFLPVLLPVASAAVVIAGIAVWEARSWSTGIIFVGGLGVAALLAPLIIWVALNALAGWRRGPSAVRLGLANLTRPGLRTTTAVTALALASALLAGPLIHRASVIAMLDGARKDGIPGLFVIDLMPDQLNAFSTLVREHTGQDAVGISPIVTARYRGREGEVDDRDAPRTREQEQDRFFRNREQRMSWRSQPGPDEQIVAGRWASPRSDGSGECTLDDDFAERLGVGIGDILLFDAHGETIRLHVVGLRKVDFLGLKPNFFILVDEQVLVDFPQTWIAAVVHPDPSSLIDALVRAIPTATCIDVAALARRIQAIVTRVLLALTAVSAFAIAAGLIVLASLSSASARERRGDAALLRALGAGNRQLRLIAGVEFAAQGLVAASVGVMLGGGLAFAVLSARGLVVAIPYGELALLASIIACSTVITGLLAVRRTWHEPPLAILRQES